MASIYMPLNAHLLFFGILTAAVIGVIGQMSSVCLKGYVLNGTLILSCTVSNLVLDVVITDPAGNIVGICVAPIRDTSIGISTECTGNLTQDSVTNTTRLEIQTLHLKQLFGTWICTHGTHRGDDNFTIFDTEEVNLCVSRDNTEGSNSIPHFVTAVVIVLSLVVVLFACNRKQWYKKLCSKVWNRKSGYQRTGTEDLQNTASEENIFRQRFCETCENLTAFSYCYQCKKFYCEACFELHSNKKPDHTIIQVEHISVSVHAAKCMKCTIKKAHRICLVCEELFCDACSCSHKHSNSVIKPLVFKSLDEIRSKCPECRLSISSDKMNLNSEIQIPMDSLPTRICGITFLTNEFIAFADYSNKKVKVFENNNFRFSYDLHKEPRCMVGLYENIVAISFPYEKEIEIHEIDLLQKRKSARILDLHDIGKPYNIAYNQEKFAVEIGSGQDGRIVIMNIDGVKLKEIKAVNFAFFTGHTIRLALDTMSERIYISAMSKKAVTCLDFEGKEKWSITIPSPRGVLFAQGFSLKENVFVASKRGNAIYQINPSNGTSNVLMASKDICNPRNIAYNSFQNCFCIQVVHDDEVDQLVLYKYGNS